MLKLLVVVASLFIGGGMAMGAVSYTHLTLPTN
ncbi:UNVERIFIED_CONTAM: hypothetical protein O1L25_14805, partial [Pseudomonas aeruginosa]